MVHLSIPALITTLLFIPSLALPIPQGDGTLLSRDQTSASSSAAPHQDGRTLPPTPSSSTAPNDTPRQTLPPFKFPKPRGHYNVENRVDSEGKASKYITYNGGLFSVQHLLRPDGQTTRRAVVHMGGETHTLVPFFGENGLTHLEIHDGAKEGKVRARLLPFYENNRLSDMELVTPGKIQALTPQYGEDGQSSLKIYEPNAIPKSNDLRLTQETVFSHSVPSHTNLYTNGKLSGRKDHRQTGFPRI